MSEKELFWDVFKIVASREIAVKLAFLTFQREIHDFSKPFHQFSLLLLVYKRYILLFISSKLIIHSAILDMHILIYA